MHCLVASVIAVIDSVLATSASAVAAGIHSPLTESQATAGGEKSRFDYISCTFVGFSSSESSWFQLDFIRDRTDC